jgi:hypothetical protein
MENAKPNSPVYIKNKYRPAKQKLDAESRVPEHVRLDIKPIEAGAKDFSDDFASASASRRPRQAKSQNIPVRPEPIAYMDRIPMVGHGEQVITGEQTVFDDEIASEEIPAPPIRHRRFVVVEDEQIPNQVVEDEYKQEPPPNQFKVEDGMLPPIDEIMRTNKNENQDVGLADAFRMACDGSYGYAIFIENDFICAVDSKEECEHAVELILSSNPPGELIVLKRVDIKIGINIGD